MTDQAVAARTAPRPKGPIVWLDMDQRALDDAYDQTKYASNREQINRRRGLLGETARARLGEPQRFAYGDKPIERLDVYPTKAANAPIMVFIHGGAWRNGTARDNAYAAEVYVNAGVHFVVLDFDSVTDVNGDLMVLADQVRRAVAWVWNNAEKFGGDRSRLYVSGHSSGAHLCGCVLTTDWSRYGVPAGIIKGGSCCSGMYELTPVRLSARSKYVNFTDEVVEELSSQRHLDRLTCPVIVAYGTLETPEFQRQNREFAAAVKAAGKLHKLVVGEAYNHFEMSETYANPYSLLGYEVLRLMQLSG